MSLFVGNLAFMDNEGFLYLAKVWVIAGSLMSGVLGFLVSRFSVREK